MNATFPLPHQPACLKARCIRSTELFDGKKVLTIRHGDEDYRLQITAAGKLILTK